MRSKGKASNNNSRDTMVRFAFWHHSGFLLNGRSVEEKPLGGTESAMIYMARALAARSNQVTVYSNVERTHSAFGVSYKSNQLAESEMCADPPDVLICLRHMLPVLALPAKMRIYFAPDAYDQPFLNHSIEVKVSNDKYTFNAALYSLKMMQSVFDSICCVGNWQAQTFQEKFAIPANKIFVVGNGIDTKIFDRSPELGERRKSVAYASTPFRGLSHLLRLFPEIKRRVPEAECDVMSGMQLYGASDDDDDKQFGDIYRLAAQPGVTLHGPLPKPEMAKILRSCRVHGYPNTFAETFCIAALEAQGAGLPVVTTALAALKERVRDGVDGYLIPGIPGNSAYDNMFVEKIVELLSDDKGWKAMSDRSFEESRNWDYDKLAKRWCDWFERQNIESRDLGLAELDVRPETVSVLIDGYPKRVELSEAIIRYHLAGFLRGLKFEDAAKRVERKG